MPELTDPVATRAALAAGGSFAAALAHAAEADPATGPSHDPVRDPAPGVGPDAGAGAAGAGGVVALRRSTSNVFALAGREVAEVFAAIPARIELSGAGPYTIGAPSVEAAVDYAEQRFGHAVVLSSKVRRGVFGSRAKVVVSTDPDAVPAVPCPSAPQPPAAPVVPAPIPVLVPPVAFSGPVPATAAVDLVLGQLDRSERPEDRPVQLTARAQGRARAGLGGAPAFGRVLDSYATAAAFEDADDEEFVAPPVLPASVRARLARTPQPAPQSPRQAAPVEAVAAVEADSAVAVVRPRLAELGVSEKVWEALAQLPAAPGRTWQAQVGALVAERLTGQEARAEESADRGGVAVIGYGPAGAAAVLSALAEGVEVAGLRKERGARLLPVTPARVVKMLEDGLPG